MLIAHLSDFHIAGHNKKAYGIVPAAQNLAHCVQHVNALIPKPDLVVITGDITNDGHLAEAEYAAVLLKELQYPYYIVPGNHDDNSVLWSVFGEHACPCKDKDFINYVIEGYDVRLIGMDSTLPAIPGGEISEQQIHWLKEQLAMESEKPTIVFMHHPPVKCGVLETDEDGFTGADKFGDVITQYDNIEGILSGHIHLTSHVRWCGTVVTTAASMGMQLVLDLTLTQPSQFNLQAPGYQLHYFTPEKYLVSHAVTVQDVDGPYRFKEYPVKSKE